MLDKIEPYKYPGEHASDLNRILLTINSLNIELQRSHQTKDPDEESQR